MAQQNDKDPNVKLLIALRVLEILFVTLEIIKALSN